MFTSPLCHFIVYAVYTPKTYTPAGMIACAESLTVYTHYPTDLTHCFHNKLTFYYAPEIEDRGAYCFCPVCHSVIPSLCHSVIPSFCHSLWNFNLANNFWTVNARALIFHMSIPCDKTFPWIRRTVKATFESKRA